MVITIDDIRVRKYLFLLGILLILGLFGCSEDFADNPRQNEPPKTFLSIFSERDLNASISRQTFNWWGDDPDGIVRGFIYTFNPDAPSLTEWSGGDDPDWTFTSNTSQTFTLRLTGTDTTFTLWVKAVDDADATDPLGATQSFPIINTKPSVEFPVGTDVPRETYTVADFVWRGSDLDGDDTIARYQYVLDDTSDASAWIDLSPGTSSVLLTAADGLTAGEHVFYLRAIDLAGASSSIVRMPREESDTWLVKEPTSNFLMIDDYNVADNTDNYYKTNLETIVGPVEVWNIKADGAALEPSSARAFLGTMKLFTRVFWYGDTGPNLTKAQTSIPSYIESGGKVLMSTSFMEFASNQGDPLDFSPADSLGPKISRLTRNQLISPTSEFATLGFPDLQVNAAIIPNVFPVVPKISSRVIYRLPESSSWPGTPSMAVIDAQGTFIFFGLPLASLDGMTSVPQLLTTIFNDFLTE